MYINYKNEEFIKGVNEQHNIMVLVGNGFDISVLKKYRKDNLITSYGKFYDYLRYKEFNTQNIFFRKMKEDKRKNEEWPGSKCNWSDFENSISELAKVEKQLTLYQIETNLEEIRGHFLLFLNEIVNTDILIELNDDATEFKWAIDSMSKFLGDLTEEQYCKLQFPNRTHHYHMFNYLFVNFNYTSLFDNYIYLDKQQYDPEPHSTVSTNFSFYPNPNDYKSDSQEFNSRTMWSSFIMNNVIHPHGYQDIPRSLIFGTEDENFKQDNIMKKLNKSYWAQNDYKYKGYIKDANLFILFGLSLGDTDRWWWRNIYEELKKEKELIIYYYGDEKYGDSIKDKFISSCGVQYNEEEKKEVKKRIFVICYTDSDKLNMFSLKRK